MSQVYQNFKNCAKINIYTTKRVQRSLSPGELDGLLRRLPRMGLLMEIIVSMTHDDDDDDC